MVESSDISKRKEEEMQKVLLVVIGVCILSLSTAVPAFAESGLGVGATSIDNTIMYEVVLDVESLRASATELMIEGATHYVFEVGLYDRLLDLRSDKTGLNLLLGVGVQTINTQALLFEDSQALLVIGSSVRISHGYGTTTIRLDYVQGIMNSLVSGPRLSASVTF